MSKRALLFLSVLATLGCSHRDEVSSAPDGAPPAGASRPGVEAPTSSARREPQAFGATLSRSTLAGVFPPAWKLGDHWRVEFSRIVGEIPGVGSEHALETATFRVASVPDTSEGRYRLELRLDADPTSTSVVTFRATDFSIASIREGNASTEHGAQPFVSGRPPIIAFPMLPPDLENPFTFPAIDREDHSEKRGWQVIEPLSQGGLRIAFVIRKNEPFGGFRAVIEWRRGDPWWSSARCFDLKGIDLMSLESAREALTCSSRLIPAP